MSGARAPGGLPLLLGAVTAVQAMATLSVLALATVAPAAAQALGIGAENVGYQVSVIYFSGAIVSAFAGTVVRRWGAGAVSQAALAFGLVGAAGVAVGGVWAVVAASLLLGIGYGLTNPAASHLLIRFTPPQRRNLVFSLKQTGVPIGGVLAGLMLPAVSEVAGWRGAVAVVALLFAALMIALAPLRRRWDTDRIADLPLRGSMVEGPRLVWRHPVLRGLALMGFCFSATQLCLLSFTVNLLVNDLGWSLVAAGAAISVVQVAGAVGRIGWALIADHTRAGAAVLVAIGAVSFAAALGLGAVTPAWPAAAVMGVLLAFGVSSNGWNGVFMAELARVAPAGTVGTATGGALMFTFAGVVVGPALFSALFGIIGTYAATFAAVAAFPLAGALLIGRAGRRERKVASP